MGKNEITWDEINDVIHKLKSKQYKMFRLKLKFDKVTQHIKNKMDEINREATEEISTIYSMLDSLSPRIKEELDGNA